MRALIVAVFIAIASSTLLLAPSKALAEVVVTVGEIPEPVDATLWSRIQNGATEAMAREPQLFMAVAVVGGLLPMASLLFFAFRSGQRLWRGRKSETFTQVAMAPAVTRQQISEIRGQLPLLDVIGADADVHRIDGSMIRIGRHEENDIRLASQTVHRYHAVLHRTPEQKFVITDLSGPEGNGVVVNAERVDQIALAAGDLIELGDVRLRFRFGEAH